MFSNSIRRNFILQLIIASAMLIFIFSSFLYFYVEKSIYDEKREELLRYAKNIANNKSITELFVEDSGAYLNLSVEVIYLQQEQTGIDLYEGTKNDHTFLTLVYPPPF